MKPEAKSKMNGSEETNCSHDANQYDNSTQPGEGAGSHESEQPTLSFRLINGESPKFTKDGKSIVDSVQYDYDPLECCFSRESVTLVDIPRLPSAYNHGYYSKALTIRLDRGEDDEIAEEIDEYLYFERVLPQKDYLGMVFLLLTSYPLLKKKHEKLFDSFRRAAVIHHDRNVAEFRRCMATVTVFLQADFPQMTFPKHILEDMINPVLYLNIVYTLRIWGQRAPFTCINYPHSLLKKTEAKLMSMDVHNVVRLQRSVPYYLLELSQGRERGIWEKFKKFLARERRK